MTEPLHLVLPLARDEVAALDAGAKVLLTGPVYTARDATHVRLAAELEAHGVLPYGLEGQTLFYAGPTPAAAGRPVGSVGPTTASRMDVWTPALIRAGIAATIGKGARSAAVREACAEHLAVYFAAVGGSAALLARHVRSVEPVAYEELGAEALVRMQLDAFPVVVAMDTRGRDLYAEAPVAWRREAGGERL